MDILRAAFVAFHLVAITLLAFPAPVGALSDKNFADRKVQETFETYAGVVSGVGPSVTGLELQRLAWDLGNGFLDARSAVLRPFRTYYAYTGTRQGWRMFGTVSDDPARLRIEVDEGAGWRVLYEARSDMFTWRRRQLDQERFRAFINDWSHLRSNSTYRQFGTWVARQVGDDLPGARQVRVTMLWRRTPDHDVLWKDGFPPDEERWQRTIAVDNSP